MTLKFSAHPASKAQSNVPKHEGGAEEADQRAQARQPACHKADEPLEKQLSGNIYMLDVIGCIGFREVGEAISRYIHVWVQGRWRLITSL